MRVRPTHCSTYEDKLRRPQFCHLRSSRVEQSSSRTPSARHFTASVQEPTENVSVLDNCYHATADLAHLLHLRSFRPINVINNNNNNLRYITHYALYTFTTCLVTTVTSMCMLWLTGEVLSTEVQSLMHNDSTSVSATRIRTIPH